MILFFLTVTSAVYAQRTNKEFIFQPIVGFSNSFQFGETINSYDIRKSRKSFTVGVLTQNDFNKRFSAILGFQYQRMGSRLIKNPVLPYYNGNDISEDIDYLSVPIGLKYYLNDEKKWNIQAGIVFSRLITSKLNKEDFSDYTRNGQFAIGFGFGYIVPINDMINISIDQQNSIGITNNTAHPDYYSHINSSKIYNFYSSVIFGLQFKLKH